MAIQVGEKLRSHSARRGPGAQPTSVIHSGLSSTERAKSDSSKISSNDSQRCQSLCCSPKLYPSSPTISTNSAPGRHWQFFLRQGVTRPDAGGYFSIM
jgi:hypothetical protein